MRRPTRLRRRRRATGISSCLLLVLGLAVALLVSEGTSSGSRVAAAASAPAEVIPQTDDAVPAREVTLFGSSPAEAANEVWGIGHSHGATAIVRYSTGAGWSLATGPLTAGGQPLAGFELDKPEPGKYSQPSPLAGQVAPNGSAALLGTVPGTSAVEPRDLMLARNPGGAFQEVAAPPATEEAAAGEVSLGKEELLFGKNRPPLLAALEEPGAKAGALVVPVIEDGTGHEESVLHWDGTKWTREPIDIPAASQGEFKVLAIGASSPTNAWLLAELSSNYPQGSVGLFRRHVEGETASWQPVAVDGGEAGGPVTVPASTGNETFTIAAGTQSQILTVTSEGLWLDGVRGDVDVTATMYLKPSGEGEANVQRAWCAMPAGGEGCAGELPEPLPSSGGRSYAWPDPSLPYGRRVITGFSTGQSLRLEGEGFAVQAALGGTPHHDVGGVYGAAFASDREGWLGQELLPVHLTEEAPQNRLTPWPVPFRKALLAIAPAPGEPVGAVTSEALAVGDNGEVARYKGAKSGWVPESLLGPGGKFETPRLRAVAWPKPNRAYAVGDFSATSQSQMWLWRGETGLWEADPATPENFRGNLLGIAFDPDEPSRGYAVGEEGALLGYGKTWQQEALPSEPLCTPIHAGDTEEARRCSTWSDATFTSIAFAGSEAIVAYRVLTSISGDQYRGGLLVNDGGGWQIDKGAAAALGEDAPYAVAGLPDGGAAFSASGLGEGSLIYERQGAGTAWQPTATPFPGRTAGSLSLFREGGALRAVATGVVPDTARLESQQAPPAGLPAELLAPYPVETSPEQGVLRQTGTGWSDEEHELNNAKEVPGEYTYYDTPYQPDPIEALLVAESGAEGWAVGGVVSSEGHALLDTSDVERYRGGSEHPEVGTADVTVAHSGVAAFAIGGDAQCEAPCEAMRDAGIGPDRWLKNALAVAGKVAGLRAFLYTGKRITSGRTAGPATVPVPYATEENRYAEVLDGSGTVAYPTISSVDLPAPDPTEQLFQSAFSSTPFKAACVSVGCQGSYYSLTSTGSPQVRVIELDETSGVGGAQLGWLSQELREAKAAGEPAIVVGSENIVKLAGEHVTWAQQLSAAIVAGEASAYFFDSPEENVKLALSSSISAYGSGTLGYVDYTNEEQENVHDAGGFMLAEVGPRDSGVNVRLIPDIGELAVEAQQGTLLRRSSAAYFQGLGRRPRSGNRAHNGLTEAETDPYVQIPGNCVGSECSKNLFPEPEFTFTSSKPDIGEFVEPVEGSENKLAVKLNSKGEPIPDAHSGLFCALNKGTTTVTLTAGGLTASLLVEVQAGSVRRPCGTTKLTEAPKESSATPPAPAPSPAPVNTAPASSPPPVPLPAPPTAVVPKAPARTPSPPPFFVNSPLPAFVPTILPPPIPTPARPTPPSGTSAVTSPVEAPEKEEEQEAAPESVSNEAVAYRSHEHEPTSAYLLGIMVLAAFAGASARRRPRRGRREVRVAPASINAMRSQRRSSGPRDPWR